MTWKTGERSFWSISASLWSAIASLLQNIYMILFRIFLSSCHFLCLTHDMGFWWYPHLYGKNIGDKSRIPTSAYKMSSSSKGQKTSFQFKKNCWFKNMGERKRCVVKVCPHAESLLTYIEDRAEWEFSSINVFGFCRKNIFDRQKHGWEMVSLTNFLTKKL